MPKKQQTSSATVEVRRSRSPRKERSVRDPVPKSYAASSNVRPPPSQHSVLESLLQTLGVNPNEIPRKLRTGRRIQSIRPSEDERIFAHLDEAANRTCHSRDYRKQAEHRGLRLGPSRGKARFIRGVGQSPSSSVQSTGMRSINLSIESISPDGKLKL